MHKLEAVSIEDAATLLHCTSGRVLELYYEGQLRGYNRGGIGKRDIRIYTDSVHDWKLHNPAVVEPSLPQTQPKMKGKGSESREHVSAQAASVLLNTAFVGVLRLYECGVLDGWNRGSRNEPDIRIYIDSIRDYQLHKPVVTMPFGDEEPQLLDLTPVEPVLPPTIPSEPTPASPVDETPKQAESPIQARPVTTVPTVVKVTQAAVMMGCSRETVRRLYSAGLLQGFVIGKPGSKKPHIRILVESIVAYMESVKPRPAPPSVNLPSPEQRQSPPATVVPKPMTEEERKAEQRRKARESAKKLRESPKRKRLDAWVQAHPLHDK